MKKWTDRKVLCLIPRAKNHGLASGIDTVLSLVEEQTMSHAESHVDTDIVPQQTSSMRKRKYECCSCVQDETCTRLNLTKQMLAESIRRNELLESIADSLQYITSRHIADKVLGEVVLSSNN